MILRAGKNTKIGTPTLPEAMAKAVELMAPDRHVANRVIILVSASYRSTDIQSVKESCLIRVPELTVGNNKI